ncbi:sugar kinase [Psychrosphaera sp. 1_MG-2023]|uniref:sugar kinase n=1 Tax=Psychrosphaera sp. 1_MG-2023 TaxID=3062643 RepID=UPI0026E3DCDB|nr:sugar kinase [Psychrosphaera sp. 1_MG-2023]MDO6719437.1 sugar kinase [Psychrosphaera sp. 1_MG-2023]
MSRTLMAIGECMMELVEQSDDLLQRSYAGDTYNALVYAKRSFPEHDAQFFSAVGQDNVSSAMVSRWVNEGINIETVQRSADHTIGIYSIAVDAEGERSFSYWRKDSAATKMMRLRSETALYELCKDADLIFFSGISLGILNEIDKAKLLSLLSKLKSEGKVIAFDPNYRPSMFKHVDDAVKWFTKAYQVATIALPGLDEHELLFRHRNKEEVVNFCFANGVNEVIVKAGKLGTYGYYEGEEVCVPFSPAPKQIDTTAAGDSFAGVYLASRLSGVNVKDAIHNAADVAKIVVQHKGAILSAALLKDCISKLVR